MLDLEENRDKKVYECELIFQECLLEEKRNDVLSAKEAITAAIEELNQFQIPFKTIRNEYYGKFFFKEIELDVKIKKEGESKEKCEELDRVE